MKYVTYRRVSTKQQGDSGLGLDAQKRDLDAWLDRTPEAQVVAEFTEVESGKRNDRPALAAALKTCRLTGATLVVAKLDRLSRNAAFLLTLRDSGVPFVALDCPSLDPITLGVLAGVAQKERELISQRTKAALAAKKAQGMRLGCPLGAAAFKGVNGGDKGREAQAVKADAYAEDFAEILLPMKAEGATLRAMAAKLMELGIHTRRGGTTWTATGVKRVLDRIGG